MAFRLPCHHLQLQYSISEPNMQEVKIIYLGY
nr:MAG TPA: aragonite protein [Caudoviricetes sp.]